MARVLTNESTLSGELARLDSENTLLANVWRYEMIGGAIFAALGLASGFAAGNWWPLGVAAFLFFLGFAHRMKRGENRADKGRFAGGAEGEKEVTRMLENQLPETYLILNDLTVKAGTRKAQNDHIVLGPNGVFVIETKAYSGTLRGSAKDDMLEQTKEWDGKRTTGKIKNPIPQNDYHLEIVGEKMREGGFVTDDLRSIIVFSNKRARVEIPDSKVPVIKPFALASTILNVTPAYSYDEEYLQRLAAHLIDG